MFGLSANESFILGVGALWVYSAAVAALHLAIEIPDSRYADFASVGAPPLIRGQRLRPPVCAGA